MALDTQVIHLPFEQGVETKTDEKVVMAPRLTLLENGMFRKTGRIAKRNGYSRLNQAILAATARDIENGLWVGNYADELLLIQQTDDNGTEMFSYSPGNEQWIAKTGLPPMRTSNAQVIRNNYQQAVPDGARAQGIEVFAWEDGRGGVRATVRDASSGVPVLTDVELHSTATRPRCLAIGGLLAVFYAEATGNDLFVRILNPLSPTAFGAEQTVATDLNATNPHYDVFEHGTKAVVAWNTTAASVKTAYVLSDGTVGAPVSGLPVATAYVLAASNFDPADVDTGADRITVTGHGLTQDTVVQFTTTGGLPGGLSGGTDYYVIVVDANTLQVSASAGGAAVTLTTQGTGEHTITPQGEAADNALAITVDPDNDSIWVAYHEDNLGVRAFRLGTDFAVELGATTVEDLTSPVVDNLTVIVPAGVGTLRLFYEANDATPSERYVKTNTLTTAGTAGTAAVLVRSVGLATKAFEQDARIQVGVVHDSTLQATVFIVTSDGTLIGKLLAGVAGGRVATPSLPRVFSTGTGTWAVALPIKTRIVSDDEISFAGSQTVVYMLTGVSVSALDFSGTARFVAVEAGQNLLLAAGMLLAYDGAVLVEHGFHLFPEDISPAGQATGGSMSDGTYQYVAVYAWADNRGQVHRSAPSLPASVTLAAGTSVQSVQVTVPTLRLTAKNNVILELYRTEGSGSIFYRVTSTSSPTYNDPTADTSVITDTLADATIIDNELLYTTGGLVEHIAAPAASLVAVGKNRVFVAGLEDGNVVWASKLVRHGAGVAFSDLFSIRVEGAGADPDSGPVTALAVLDQNVILFKQHRIYAFTGDGPDDTGQQGQFSQPELVTTDMGCNIPESIVMIPAGLMFKSAKGIHLIDRGLRTSYIGTPVEEWNDLTVTGAVLAETENEVRFVTSEGRALVYDYFQGQWATWTNHAAVGATRWNNRFCYLRSDGAVHKEEPGVFRDDNSRFSLRIRTAWIKLAGIQGYQRVRRLMVLGNFKANHVLRVSVGYDFQPGYPDIYLFDAAALVSTNYYGEGAYYGADEVYGGVEDAIYQFMATLGQQKCQAVRVLIEDVMADTVDESYDMVGLALLAGVKPGLHRIRTGKRA